MVALSSVGENWVTERQIAHPWSRYAVGGIEPTGAE